ncbi:MAG TPA: addiction module protein [Gemmataceae bacterium]|nr:addiction module protein [Gemmataceae bacterium]
MTRQAQAICDAALALSEAERTELVERLLHSLPPDPDEMSDDEFYAELERRRAEIEKDPSAGVPWTDVLGGQ